MATVYLGVKDIAREFGVRPNTPTAWLRRYPDCPQPDAFIRKTPGWLPERLGEWSVWYLARGLKSGRLP